MYIISIGWLYVVVLMAALERSWVGGILTLVFYGMVPLSILLYLYGTPERRRRMRQREHDAGADPVPSGLPDEPVREADGSHAEQDQADLGNRGG